ncbi:MAG: Holliday junction branch migration protein RuvA [Solibacterales bacterium]|nr:Holliday junction branch migration protein RuvA [Bryobacterales bacterium]|tara:strand:+ start:15810 stop:16409 length:600 start_codon:yes stop_codon:yes gene_type:complete
MIAHLRGKLREKQPNLVTVDVAGVGYAVIIPVSTYAQLNSTGTDISLEIHTHVREDALVLFGFISKREKGVFEKLITVGGIGPRLAITILSGLPADELVSAIRTGDVSRLTCVPGVGKKTGERIVLELREKLDVFETESSDAEQSSGAGEGTVEQEVISALLNLGCSRDAARSAVSKARREGCEGTFESLFRRALELIS